MNTFLNRHGVKKKTLAVAKELRPAWAPSRVSDEFLDYLDGVVLNAIRATVQSAPSIGKTLKPPTSRK